MGKLMQVLYQNLKKPQNIVKYQLFNQTMRYQLQAIYSPDLDFI